MDEERLSIMRSAVIEKAINLEWVINAIISQHYFKKVALQFVTEVLYDEYCSFALKRRILEKIIKNPDEQQIQKINRLNTIRNYFAHCGQQIFDGPEVPPAESQKGWVPDPRKPTKPIDFEKLHDEFMKLEKEVINYLFGIFQQIGGVAAKPEE